MGVFAGKASVAREVDKCFVGVSNLAREVDKIFVGDANGKAQLLWSGFTPMFVGATHKRLYTSVDGKVWTCSDVPWDSSYIGSSTAASACIGMTYGLGKYWLANGKYLCSSEDGITWTIVKTTVNETPYKTYGFRKVFYVNGQIVAHEQPEWAASQRPHILHITSDGVNWSTAEFNEKFLHIKDMYYGSYKGSNVYFWLCTTGTSLELYTSQTLAGARTEILSCTGVSYQSNGADYSQMVITEDGYLYLTTGDSSSSSIRRINLADGSGSGSVINNGSAYIFHSLYALETDAVTYRYGKDFYHLNSDASNVGYYTIGGAFANYQYNLHPPHNEDGLVAFPAYFSSSSIGCGGAYKPKSSTAFTIVSQIGTASAGDDFVVAYGTDGGGWSY